MSSVGRFLVSGLIVITVYYAVFGGEYSLFELYAARVDVDDEQVTLAELEQDLDSLEALTEALRDDPATLERVAREEFGMIREGETLYRFAVPEDSVEAVVDEDDAER